MPINYEVDAAGRAGAELRVARRDMRLVCTGPAARLGLLLPHLTTTTTRSPSTGQPVTVRVQYLLPLWLAAGTLVANDAVKQLLVYEYLLGCERCGAAIDCLLAHWTDNTPVSPSVLRKFFITTAVRLRAETPATFTVTPACMLLVGGAADDTELRALATPQTTPSCMPVWMRTVTYDHLLPPDGTFIAFSELETTWWPRVFPSQRADGGCFTIFAGMHASRRRTRPPPRRARAAR